MPTTNKIIATHAHRIAAESHLTHEALARRIGISPRKLGMLKSGKGNPTMDTIEKLASFDGKKPWELMRPLYVVAATTGAVPVGYVRLDRLAVAASAGVGAEPLDYPEIIGELDVLESWARQTLGAADPKRIKIITCHGDSMFPTIQPGEVVFVDISTPHFETDGIYVLIWQGRLIIKRLRAMLDGRLAIQSDNSSGYPTEYVTAAQMDQLDLCGRVVGWWTLRKA